MSSQEFTDNDKKHIVSMRLNNNDRNAIQNLASRLFVRESELYRLAVSHLLIRLQKLHDPDCSGSDLLPLFIEFREELIQNLGLKKQQLFKIVNNFNARPDKFVTMADLELLLLPPYLVRKRLLLLDDALAAKQQDTNEWLVSYFIEKYGLPYTTKDRIEAQETEA